MQVNYIAYVVINISVCLDLYVALTCSLLACIAFRVIWR